MGGPPTSAGHPGDPGAAPQTKGRKTPLAPPRCATRLGRSVPPLPPRPCCFPRPPPAPPTAPRAQLPGRAAGRRVPTAWQPSPPGGPGSPAPSHPGGASTRQRLLGPRPARRGTTPDPPDPNPSLRGPTARGFVLGCVCMDVSGLCPPSRGSHPEDHPWGGPPSAWGELLNPSLAHAFTTWERTLCPISYCFPSLFHT